MSKVPEELVITVYRITGRQLFFSVAGSICEECDLTVSAVNRAVHELGADGIRIKVDVRPWLNNLIRALSKGAYHPPVVLVDGKVVSQGLVPTVEGLNVAIREAVAERNTRKTRPYVDVSGLPVGESAKRQRISAFDGTTRRLLAS